MCRPRSRPIVAIKVAESPAFGRASIRWFHTFDAGKTGQPGAPGSDGAPPVLVDGWLAGSVGSVPARTSPLSVNPSPSVSTLLGWVPRFCSLRLLRPSLSRSSFASERRSPSVSALRGWTTARGSLQFHRPSRSGSSRSSVLPSRRCRSSADASPRGTRRGWSVDRRPDPPWRPTDRPGRCPSRSGSSASDSARSCPAGRRGPCRWRPAPCPTRRAGSLRRARPR